MIVLNLSSVMSLFNISSISVQSCDLLGMCDIPYQLLSSASCGILVDFFDTVVLKYSLSVKKRLCSMPLSDWSFVLLWADKVLRKRLCQPVVYLDRVCGNGPIW